MAAGSRLVEPRKEARRPGFPDRRWSTNCLGLAQAIRLRRLFKLFNTIFRRRRFRFTCKIHATLHKAREINGLGEFLNFGAGKL